MVADIVLTRGAQAQEIPYPMFTLILAWGTAAILICIFIVICILILRLGFLPITAKRAEPEEEGRLEKPRPPASARLP
jgi:hypothetical protein